MRARPPDEATLELSLHRVEVTGPDRPQFQSLCIPIPSREQRLAFCAGANDLAGVEVNWGQLARRMCGHISHLSSKAERKLFLNGKVPGLNIAPLELFGIASESDTTRDINDAIAGIGRRDRRDTLSKRRYRKETVGRL